MGIIASIKAIAVAIKDIAVILKGMAADLHVIAEAYKEPAATGIEVNPEPPVNRP